MKRTLLMAAILVAGAAASAQATSIGPDTYGYRAYNVAYDFKDISATGTLLPYSGNADDMNWQVGFGQGFNFSLYGRPWQSAFVSSNGLITFGSGSSSWTNVGLSSGPAGDLPVIAPLWDDWRTTGAPGEGVYYQTVGDPGSRSFIAQWQVERYYFGQTMGQVSFEAILYEGTGNILFQYRDVITGDASYNNGNSATVGIRDTGGRNLQWSFNSPAITDGEAILFTTHPIPEPVTMAGVLLAAGALTGYVRRRR